MNRSVRKSSRRIAVAIGAAVALVAAVPVSSGAQGSIESASPAITIPLDTGALTVNGFTMNWPAQSVTGAKLVGTWDPATGALDVALESSPVALSFPQLTGGTGSVTTVNAAFTGTALPGQTTEVSGAVTVVVTASSPVLTGASVAQPAGTVCGAQADRLPFTATLVPIAGGYGLTLTANGFPFPFESGYLDLPGEDPCEVAFMEIATGTPTVATNLTFSGTVTVAPPAPAPTPQPATPAFTG
jgi:hypothetical protein